MTLIIVQLLLCLIAPLVTWPLARRIGYNLNPLNRKWEISITCLIFSGFFALLVIPFYPDPTPATYEQENHAIAPASLFTALALVYGVAGLLHAALAKLSPRFPRRAAFLQFCMFQSGIVIAQSPNLAWLSARDLDRHDCDAFMLFWYDLSDALLILPQLALALMLVLLVWALFTRLRRPQNRP